MNQTHTHLKPDIDFKYEPITPRQKKRKTIVMSELSFNILTTFFLFAMAFVGMGTCLIFFFKWLSTYW